MTGSTAGVFEMRMGHGIGHQEKAVEFDLNHDGFNCSCRAKFNQSNSN
jgi:hypothetical protein